MQQGLGVVWNALVFLKEGMCSLGKVSQEDLLALYPKLATNWRASSFSLWNTRGCELSNGACDPTPTLRQEATRASLS